MKFYDIDWVIKIVKDILECEFADVCLRVTHASLFMKDFKGLYHLHPVSTESKSKGCLRLSVMMAHPSSREKDSP